jgi:hypothetical protein
LIGSYTLTYSTGNTTENILACIDSGTQSPFDSIRRFDEHGNEYWLARELQKLLGYSKWDKFAQVIERVAKSIGLQGLNHLEHITQTGKQFSFGNGAVKEGVDFKLTRFACYLIAMSGDNSKPEIAQAQSYFALKTREAEVAQQPIEIPRQLPPIRDTIEYLQAARDIEVFPDPIIRSLLNQRLMEELGSKSLSSMAIATQVILTVRAKELGFSDKQIGSGTQLGKFVAKVMTPTGKTQHGRYPVNVYDLTPELDESIKAYFR